MIQQHIWAAGAATVLMATAAGATPATQEGADRIKAALQTYLSATEGVVSVVPGGETYDLTLDFQALAALVPTQGMTVEMQPMIYKLTDRGDGTWGVTEDQGFSLKVMTPGVADVTYTVGSVMSEGVWDESLASFSQYTAKISDLNYAIKTFSPDGTVVSDDGQKIASGTVTMTGAAGASGGTDVGYDFAFNGYTQVMTIPGNPGAPAAPVTVTAETYSGTSKMPGFRSEAFLKLVSWFVAHPSEEAIKGGQDELRPLLAGLVPFFDRMSGTLSLTKLGVETPVGPFGAATVAVDVEANGIVADGMVREAFRVGGLTVPPGVAPDWAATLMPTDVAFDFRGSRFDLATPIAKMIEVFDLTKPEPVDEATMASLAGQFMPSGNMDVELRPGLIKGADYEVTFEGAMTVGPGQMPVGKGVVRARGLDKVQAALAAAPPEVSGQVLMPMGMATGLAKTEADGTLVWEIDGSVPGSLKVNGNVMMGGAAP
jgi:hypothetical protein